MTPVFSLSRLENRRLLSASSEVVVERLNVDRQPVDAVAGEAIVQFHVGKTNSIAKQRRLIREAIQPAVTSMYLKESLGSRGLFLVGFDSTRYSVSSALARLDSLSRVAYAEPNALTHIAGDAAPNDSGYGFSHHLNNTGANGSIAGTPDADIDAPEAWNITTGSRSVVIAILDTGIQLDHPDLAANLWTNPGEVAGDGIDNDFNGKIDDVNGWNFVADNADVSDDAGHGTVVAGVAGAVGNNGIGAVGVNWNVSLLPVRWRYITNGGGQTGSLSDAINAVNYVVGLKQRGINIRVANNSYGDVKSSALRDAYQRAIDNGVVLVASAGNEARNNDLNPRFPTNYDQMITVGATDAFDHLASFSNFGTSVELAAPGKDVYTTLLTQFGGYGRVNGTSFAAAGVSGAVALLAAAKPDATYTELRNAILGGVDVIPGLAGTNATSGRLNVHKSLQVLLGKVAPGPIPAIGKGTITGRVFGDVDGFGYLDAGESGVGGRLVYIDANNNAAFDAGELSAVSAADGTYTLTRVANGNHTVRVVAPGGLRVSGPDSGAHLVYVDYGVTYTAKNFGLTAKSMVSGKVFNDLDGFGGLEAGESGIAGVTVFDDVNNNGVRDTGERQTVTNAAGDYALRTYDAGNIARIKAVLPAGYRNAGDAVEVIQIAAGRVYAGKNLGITTNALVSGNVMIDTDESGTLTAGDTPAAGWRVFADLNNDGLFNGSDRRVTANADGFFVFRTLAAGTYNLVLELQGGFTATSPMTQAVPVASGQVLGGLYFGVKSTLG